MSRLNQGLGGVQEPHSSRLEIPVLDTYNRVRAVPPTFPVATRLFLARAFAVVITDVRGAGAVGQVGSTSRGGLSNLLGGLSDLLGRLRQGESAGGEEGKEGRGGELHCAGGLVRVCRIFWSLEICLDARAGDKYGTRWFREQRIAIGFIFVGSSNYAPFTFLSSDHS